MSSIFFASPSNFKTRKQVYRKPRNLDVGLSSGFSTDMDPPSRDISNHTCGFYRRVTGFSSKFAIGSQNRVAVSILAFRITYDIAGFAKWQLLYKRVIFFLQFSFFLSFFFLLIGNDKVFANTVINGFQAGPSSCILLQQM